MDTKNNKDTSSKKTEEKQVRKQPKFFTLKVQEKAESMTHKDNCCLCNRNPGKVSFRGKQICVYCLDYIKHTY
jgi:ethanolamine utilization cobalamin adenosyltransferase